MAVLDKQALVSYSAEEMYALVADIASYPQFLPWCKRAGVTQRDSAEVEASITIARGALEKEFTTINVLTPNESIEMRLNRGPFSHLHGRWLFSPLGDSGCKVSLHMDFEISNRLLKMTLGPVFNHIINTLIDAFIQRAGDLYGQR